MKKSIIFVLIAVLAVSFSSPGSSAPKFLKKAKDKITGKDDKKKKENKAAPVPLSKDVVLVKGLQISWCGNEVEDDGSVTIPGLKDVTLPVKKGKFDLTLPSTPVFGDEEGLNQQSGFSELDFGSAKVYQFRIMYFENSNTTKSREETAGGRGGLPFSIYYSDSDVKGTIDGTPVELKKGWNIVGDKTVLEASLMCAG
jgi:hypothetical protein